MLLGQHESDCKSYDQEHIKQSNPTDRAARRLAETFAITVGHANEIVRLAGIGEPEARR